MPVTALIPAGAQFAGGLFQSIFGGNRARKAQDQLEALKTPTYTPNKGIGDYYSQALQRYGINPYQSQQYQYSQNQANRATAAGLSSLQGRRGAVAGVGRLAGIQNDAMLRAGITAENQRTQNFNQLGNATGMKASDDRYGFQINKMMPYEKELQLLGLKASGGNQIMNAGLSNIFGGLGNASMVAGDYLNNQNGGGYQNQFSAYRNNRNSPTQSRLPYGFNP